MLAKTERERVVRVNGTQVKVTTPKKITNGVVLYGHVLASDGGRFYPVAKRHIGGGRFSYRCGCDFSVLAGRLCKHVAVFVVAERGGQAQ